MNRVALLSNTRHRPRRQAVRRGPRRMTASRSWLGSLELRRLGWLLLFLLFMGGLVRGGEWLLAPGRFPIGAINVSGQLQHLSRKKIQRLIGTHLQGGFFGANLTDIARALQSLPWVKGVSIRRIWPNRLDIYIVKQKPRARWDGTALLNAKGQVFHPPPNTWPTDLPNLYGPTGGAEMLWVRYERVQRLFALAGLNVMALHEDARHAYRLRLNNDIKVIIGRNWSLLRMKKMLVVYRRLLAPRATMIARIDLRYPNGFAVAWKVANSGTSNQSKSN